MHWYTVHTKKQQERLVEQILQSLGIETFCPRLRHERVLRGRHCVMTAPLFPGYLFACLNLGTHYRAVNYAHGVRHLVDFGGGPVVVDDGTILSLRSRMRNGILKAPRPVFRPGQSVQIRTGPLRGLEGVCDYMLSDKQRVVILLQALAFQARTEVSLEDLAAM